MEHILRNKSFTLFQCLLLVDYFALFLVLLAQHGTQFLCTQTISCQPTAKNLQNQESIKIKNIHIIRYQTFGNKHVLQNINPT